MNLGYVETFLGSGIGNHRELSQEYCKSERKYSTGCRHVLKFAFFTFYLQASPASAFRVQQSPGQIT